MGSREGKHWQICSRVMDYTDLISKYPVERPLSEVERSDQLKQKQQLEVMPHYDLSIIKINSTFVEMIDKFYSYRGILTTIMLVMIVIAVWFGGISTWSTINDLIYPEDSQFTRTDLYIDLILTVAIHGGLSGIGFYFLLKETFTYTHFPKRFNRKSRMIYVFRKNGTVLKTKWDDVFFTCTKERDIWGESLECSRPHSGYESQDGKGNILVQYHRHKPRRNRAALGILSPLHGKRSPGGIGES